LGRRFRPPAPKRLSLPISTTAHFPFRDPGDQGPLVGIPGFGDLGCRPTFADGHGAWIAG
jgi:hypothetical protein